MVLYALIPSMDEVVGCFDQDDHYFGGNPQWTLDCIFKRCSWWLQQSDTSLQLEFSTSCYQEISRRVETSDCCSLGPCFLYLVYYILVCYDLRHRLRDEEAIKTLSLKSCTKTEPQCFLVGMFEVVGSLKTLGLLFSTIPKVCWITGARDPCQARESK